MFSLDKALSLLERIDNQYHQYKLLTETTLINEGDSRLKIVNRIIEQTFSSLLDLDGTVRSQEYYVNNNPNTTWRQYLMFNLRHTFGLMDNSDVKYLPVVARLAYSDEVKFDITNSNGEQIAILRRIVNIFKKDEQFFQQVKSNPDITFTDIYNQLKDTFEQQDKEDADAANNVSGGGNGYTIVEVPDYETAHYYGNYSCSKSRLCYTESESTWNSYTNHGENKVYVCLKDGWQNTPEVATEGNPYDAYGVSMIFVFIGPMGNITTSNCRWNHHTDGQYDGGADHAFTRATLAQTIGIPFDKAFNVKPLSKQRLIQMIEQDKNELRISPLEGIAVGDFVIPEGTKRIGNYAFSCCNGLKSVTIPNSVEEIGEWAFAGCSGLTSVTIGNSVETIGSYAFYYCSNLTSVTIGNFVNEIGEGAFASCTGLTSVTISNSVKSIGKAAFLNCIELTSVTISNSVEEIGDRAFDGCNRLTSVVIGNLVKTIGKCAFYCCSALTSVIIPNSVERIGASAFIGCTRLTSVTIPNSVNSIGPSAFRYCIDLTIHVYDTRHAVMVRNSGFEGEIEQHNV